jgi:hypothetical protein
MFFEKSTIIICLLLANPILIQFVECNICQKSQITIGCTPSNSKYRKITNLNDVTLDNSFLLSSFDSNSNLKCLSGCSTNDQCEFSVFKQNKCYLCKTNIIRFLSYNNAGNCLIYQKTDSKFFNFILFQTFI